MSAIAKLVGAAAEHAARYYIRRPDAHWRLARSEAVKHALAALDREELVGELAEVLANWRFDDADKSKWHAKARAVVDHLLGKPEPSEAGGGDA